MDKIFLLLIIIQVKIINSSENCYYQCKECYEYSNDKKDMKCKSCNGNNIYLLYNTTNCEHRNKHNDYYKNQTNEYITLYPCSYYDNNSNCYECDPFNKSETGGICISCKFGYYYNSKTKTCSKCLEGELSIVLSDFDNCIAGDSFQFCDRYKTYCSKDIIECPNIAPIFNNITKTCSEMDCPEEEFKNGECQIKIQKYKDRLLFINWFNGTMLAFPSFNNDNSGLLLIEYSPNIEFFPKFLHLKASNQRQLYFYNSEGRGCFNEINDEYNKLVNLDKEYFRFFSTSVAIRVNNEEKYEYLLNFEYYEGNMELINIKTGEISQKNFFSLNTNSFKYDYEESSHKFPIMFLSETNEKNVYLLGFFVRINKDEVLSTGIYLFLFNFISSNKTSTISIDSINIFRANLFIANFLENSKISCIQTKSGYFILTGIDSRNYIVSLAIDSKIRDSVSGTEISNAIPETFLKRVFLKDEKSLLIYHQYYRNIYMLFICLQDFNYKLNVFFELIYQGFQVEISDGIFYYSMDAIALSENRVIILSQQLHGRILIIHIFDFLDNYRKYFKINYKIKIINQKMHLFLKDSLIFKYKDTLGLQFQNMKGENGFVIFGYFNSSDPKQIYNIKKDGLEYNIKLNQYLFLQSNIFGYEIKGIKIIAIPETNSGLYFISNITKKELKLNETLDYNTEITLNFARDIIHKGKYLFKFAGVLQEPNLYKILNYSDFDIQTNEEYNVAINKCIEFYENNTNKSIIGKAALVQINIFDDIEIFCDEKNDGTCLKSNNICLTCGEGKFYDVENANEITQLLIGKNYYFDNHKKVFVKCHKRCKSCSNEYSLTNMQCDEC